jgi:UDP-glucose 4-epimerase
MGYIGSHTVVGLIAAGYDMVTLDNLTNSSAKVLDWKKSVADPSHS